MPFSADSQRGRLNGVAADYTDTGGVDLRLTAERSGSAGACLWMREAFVPVLDELTALQADAIRATAAAHDRDPDELARELMHLLAADKTSEAINRDLLTHCISELRKLPFSKLNAGIDAANRTVTVGTDGLDRLGVFFEGHPGSTHELTSGVPVMPAYPQGTKQVSLTGFDDDEVRQRRTIRL